MLSIIHAIYEDGQLRLLDPVELQNGQAVKLTIKVRDACDALSADKKSLRWRYTFTAPAHQPR